MNTLVVKYRPATIPIDWSDTAAEVLKKIIEGDLHQSYTMPWGLGMTTMVRILTRGDHEQEA